MSRIIKDENRIPELVRQLELLDKRKVEMGIVAPSGDEIYMVAWVHEFGIDIHVTNKMRGWFLGQGMPIPKSVTSITIPERGYFRGGIAKNRGSINSKKDELLGRVLDGKMTAYEAFDKLGEFAADKIKNNVSNVGLVKTGKLKDSIGFMVRLK